MVDAYLIIVSVVMAFLILAAVFLMLIQFGHPDDKSAAYFPKAVTVLGLWLAFASILVLPFDIANQSTSLNGGGVSIDTLWTIVYILLFILIAALIPFAFFYYESDVDADDLPEGSGFCATQLGSAIGYTFAFAAVICVLLAILYTQVSTARVPVNRITQSLNTVLDMNTDLREVMNGVYTVPSSQPTRSCVPPLCGRSQFVWAIPVSFPLYLIAFLSFLGWFFFTMFVGVGLAALPLDLINDYRTRPTPITTKVYFEQRAELGNRVKQLIETGEKMSSSQEKSSGGIFSNNRAKTDVRNFEKNYYMLKKDYQILYIAHKLKGGNPVWYIFKLVLGLLGLVLSVTWLIHIAIFILPAERFKTNFLNLLFHAVEIKNFALFGVLFFAVYAFYLLWCVVKGNFKLGVRFLFWKIYPMELSNTLMNAFLLNTWFILMCSLPCVQFCVQAFPDYVSGSEANVMFGQLVKYMDGFRYLFQSSAFVFGIIIIAGLSFGVFLICPNSRAASVEAQLDKIAKSKNTSLTDYNDD